MKRIHLTLALAGFAAAALSTAAAAKPITVNGRLLGVDGAPMLVAAITLSSAEEVGAEPTFTSVDDDGAFTLSVPGIGVYWLIAHGVDHAMHRQPLLLADARPVSLEIRLGTYERAGMDSVRVIGTFNGFDFDRGAVAMVRNADGIFTADIPWDGATLDYQLLGVVPEHSINGTMASSHAYDGGGDYQSTIDVDDGVAHIAFDPRMLPAAGRAPIVECADAGSKVATFLRINAEMERRARELRQAAKEWDASGRSMSQFRYDNAAELLALATQIGAEKDAFTRQLLLISYLDIQSSTGRDSTIALMAAKEIEPESMLWALGPSRIYTMYNRLGKLETPMSFDEYVDRASTGHPLESVRVQLLMMRLQSAHYAKDSVAERELYEQITTKYPKSQFAKMARTEFGPDRAIMVGKKVPAFSFASLTDSTVTYSNESFLGRYYLIDFWATWCGPCIGEMENMHAAYDRFHSRNFEILSLSFDASPEQVTSFIEKKWKMPWRHSFVEGGFGHPTSVLFGVNGIPKPILVGPDGTILATEEDLRGAALEKTLDRILVASGARTTHE